MNESSRSHSILLLLLLILNHLSKTPVILKIILSFISVVALQVTLQYKWRTIQTDRWDFVKILIYFYSLGFSLNARPHKRQRFNHHRVEIKVVVLYCIVRVTTTA